MQEGQALPHDLSSCLTFCPPAVFQLLLLHLIAQEYILVLYEFPRLLCFHRDIDALRDRITEPLDRLIHILRCDKHAVQPRCDQFL